MKMEDIIDEMAKMIIQENEAYIGRDVAKESVKEINESAKKRKTKEEGDANGEQKTVKKRTRRTAKTA